MALTAVATATWQKAYTGAVAGAKATCSVGNGTNYPGSIGTIGNSADGQWRLDRQSPPQGKTNLQIQKNNAPNPSTVACVIVPDNLSTQVGALNAPGPLQQRARARNSELTRMIHKGLSQSVDSRRAVSGQAGHMEVQVFEVQGTFSA